jgi:hypothetical protein
MVVKSLARGCLPARSLVRLVTALSGNEPLGTTGALENVLTPAIVSAPVRCTTFASVALAAKSLVRLVTLLSDIADTSASTIAKLASFDLAIAAEAETSVFVIVPSAISLLVTAPVASLAVPIAPALITGAAAVLPTPPKSPASRTSPFVLVVASGAPEEATESTYVLLAA